MYSSDFMCKGGLVLELWSWFVLFLPLSIGVSTDGSCFDVFGYTDELNI